MAVLGSSVQRSAGSKHTSRNGAALRRRAAVGVLVALSLVLITIYFRESPDGGLHSAQGAGATALRPLQVGAERVVRPFRDAYGWASNLIHAKSENDRLREEVTRWRQEAIQYRRAFEENKTLRELLEYKAPSTYPGDFEQVFAAVIAPPSEFAQLLVIAAGESDGVRVNDPVVNRDGLVGRVTKVTRDTSQVTLLLDQSTAVSALDLETDVTGLVEHGRAGSGTLVLNRVDKRYVVKKGDEIVTAGSSSERAPSLYPLGIPIGRVSFVSQSDTDLYKRIQIQPAVDFGSLDAVAVLVPTEGRR